ncbi:MAG: diguanylate cyclase, partial [Tardiphaga sp.]
MPKFRPAAKKKAAGQRAGTGRPIPSGPKLRPAKRPATPDIGEIVRRRAQAEAAVAEARRSHERLREAIDILPQGIVFL